MSANAAKTASEEALELLRRVVDQLSMPNADLSFALRSLLRASHLMGWSDAADWFSKEIKGYNGKSPIPAHRHAIAYVEWRPYAVHDVIEQVVSSRRRAPDREPVPWALRAGIDQLIQYAQKGVIVKEEAAEERWMDIGKKTAKGRKVTVLEAPSAKHCLERLQNELFEWASESYAALRFGDVTKDIWDEYRVGVDQALANVGLGHHSEAITRALTSDNPQDWRQAMWSCRDLLRDLAAYLWCDTRKTYAALQGDDGKPFTVTPDRYVNRMVAYLHVKGVTGTTGAYLRAEVARLHALNDLDSTAHDPVAKDDARLAVVATYLVLGELVNRTDMVPVEKY